MLLSLVFLILAATGSASADKGGPYEVTTNEVESALHLQASLSTPSRIRPGAPVQLNARLVNRSAKRAHKVIRPGNGSQWGIVEPFVHYTVRFREHRGEQWRDVAIRAFSGMCGMGDYRWHPGFTELAPAASIDFTNRLSAVSTFASFDKPGHYEIRLHYDFRRKGTTEKLPWGDGVGDLGPMRRMPKYEITSEPIHVQVMPPIAVIIERRAKPQKGVAKRLSDLVRVRLENWTGKPLAIDASKLTLFVRLRSGKQAAKVRRKPLSVKAGFTKRTLAPGGGAVLIGPKGVYDEAWVQESDGAVDLHVVVAGATPTGPRIRSDWTILAGP